VFLIGIKTCVHHGQHALELMVVSVTPKWHCIATSFDSC